MTMPCAGSTRLFRRPVSIAVSIAIAGASCAGPGIRPEAAAPVAAGVATPIPSEGGTSTTTTVPTMTTTTGRTPVPAPDTPAATTSTTVSRFPVAGEQTRQRLVIHAVGDVGMSVEQNGRFLVDGFEVAWTGLDGLFRRDDLTIVNLECAPSDRGAPLDKEWAFRCDRRSLPVMASFGVDAASMANNHSGDMGTAALVDGRAALEAAGLNPIGAGVDLAEAMRPAFFDVGGWRVAVVGLAAVGGGDAWFAGPSWPGVAPADRATIETAVGAAASAADLVVVSVHWGAEELPGPTPGDVERARWMIEAGADVIFGHHSHRLQPLEYLDGRPVFWSLGDFVWPVLEHRSEETAVAEIVVESDGRVSARLVPAFIVSDGRPVLLAPPDYTLRASRPF